MSRSASPPDDPWAGARDRARDDVRAIFAPRRRVCPACGAESQSAGATCPSCGARYVATAPARRPSARTLAIVALALAALSAAAAVALSALDERRSEREAREARALAAARAEAVRLVERESAPRRGGARPPRRPLDARAEVAARTRLVARLERAVLADARARVRAGTLSGPALDVACSPYPRSLSARGAERDPARAVGRYECFVTRALIPASERNAPGAIGHPYLARVDFRTFRWAFCKVAPPPAEKAIPARSPRVPAACTNG